MEIHIDKVIEGITLEQGMDEVLSMLGVDGCLNGSWRLGLLLRIGVVLSRSSLRSPVDWCCPSQPRWTAYA